MNLNDFSDGDWAERGAGEISSLRCSMERATPRSIVVERARAGDCATTTLDELERWLTDDIVCVYHAKRHRGIGTSPLQRWTPVSSAMSALRDEAPSTVRRTRSKSASISCRSSNGPCSPMASQSKGFNTTATSCAASSKQRNAAKSVSSCFSATRATSACPRIAVFQRYFDARSVHLP
jgi:hypothetical protein